MIIDNKYVLGSRSSVMDSRRKWEDRVFVGQIVRPGGQKYIVGIVADGVGSADYGSRGAQLAVDKVVEYITQGPPNDVPQMIKEAIKYANNAVFQENQVTDGDGLTTLVLAIIHNDRLFIGNVGDSRAYWVQTTLDNKNTKMLQLTRDHTYLNIYGGMPDAEHANSLVNSIGNAATVQIDLGFYLKGADVDKAYNLGLSGLPLKPGDTVLLCSDGLIKESPAGDRYATDAEIMDAIATEYEPDKAVIKMISRAEGRKPDDNVSAVTIQYLSPELVKHTQSHSESAKWKKMILTGLFALGGVVALVLIIVLLVRLGKSKQEIGVLQQTQTPQFIVVTGTPEPTIAPTAASNVVVKAIVDLVKGGSANVGQNSPVNSGDLIKTNGGIVRVKVQVENQPDGFIYLFRQSSARIIFTDTMDPQLKKGAIYIQPWSSIAYVDLSYKVGGLKASVTGSRMIVEIKDIDIWIYCFEGNCQLEPQGESPILVEAGYKMVYHIASSTADRPEEMSYNEQWEWNERCLKLCLSDKLPMPTSTSVDTYLSPTATKKPEKPKEPPKPEPNKQPDSSVFTSIGLHEMEEKSINSDGLEKKQYLD